MKTDNLPGTWKCFLFPTPQRFSQRECTVSTHWFPRPLGQPEKWRRIWCSITCKRKFGKHLSGEQSGKGEEGQVVDNLLQGKNNTLLRLSLSNLLTCDLLSPESPCFKKHPHTITLFVICMQSCFPMGKTSQHLDPNCFNDAKLALSSSNVSTRYLPTTLPNNRRTVKLHSRSKSHFPPFLLPWARAPAFLSPHTCRASVYSLFLLLSFLWLSLPAYIHGISHLQARFSILQLQPS